jgi:kynurenine formamidase
MPRPSQPLLSKREFVALADRLRRSTTPPLNEPQTVLRARSLIRTGHVVAMGDTPAMPPMPITSPAAPATSQPYRLQQWYEAADEWAAVNDRLEIDIHGATSMTHIDALHHFYWHDKDFHGRPRQLPKPGSVPVRSRPGLESGIVGRGVLIDVPTMTGSPVPPGHVLSLDDVAAALARQRITLQPGDAVYISFGRRGQRRSEVALHAEHHPGLSIECAQWLADANPAVVVTDEGLDAHPSEVDGLPVPWHVLMLTVLGIPLVDMAALAQLARTCARLGRWEFFSTIAPLDIPNASGSPVNPLAVF